MHIRKATYNDIPRIMEICAEARDIMRSNGNMTQWTGGYPSEETIMADIDTGVGYVVWNGEEDSVGHVVEEAVGDAVGTAVGEAIGKTSVRKTSVGKTVGYFALIPGIEKTYIEIEGGRWIDDSAPYCTIHRLGSTKTSRGVARACFEWSWGQCRNLRIDTHEDNGIMRHCIEGFGFAYCGVIHLEDGSPRLAYQKVQHPLE